MIYKRFLVHELLDQSIKLPSITFDGPRYHFKEPYLKDVIYAPASVTIWRCTVLFENHSPRGQQGVPSWLGKSYRLVAPNLGWTEFRKKEKKKPRRQEQWGRMR